ncbi:MAG: FtsQ-type POTRA domain-containing protein [Thermicanus sp.]|nr:FtsQ-type POTRA domain-containing protein [Thermicanus sp.]
MTKKKQKKRGRMIRLLFIFFFLILIILYLQSPLSKIQEIRVSGNERLTDAQVIGKSGLQVGRSIFILPSSIAEKLKKDPEIKSAQVFFRFPSGFLLQVKENKIIALLGKDGGLQPILENGHLLTSEEKMNEDLPIITNWSSFEELPSFCSELSQLKPEVMKEISEIRSAATPNDRYKVEVYMKDQFEVETTTLHFSKYMNLYPYIKEKLKGKEPGVITMNESGTFYISYKEFLSPKSQEQNPPGQNSLEQKNAGTPTP